jgi:hypothetical protein
VVALLRDSPFGTGSQFVFFPQAKTAGVGRAKQAIEKWRFLCFWGGWIFRIFEFLRKNADLWTMVAAGLERRREMVTEPIFKKQGK